MKPVHFLFSLAAVCAQTAAAQAHGTVDGRDGASHASDQMTLARVDQARNRLEMALKSYLVAFDGHMVNEPVRVGVPLASLAHNRLNLAYDPAGKNVMAQWHFAQTTLGGKRLDYKAYVGASGGVSMVLSTRF
ncbi:MAG: hypothetical protein IPH37_10850 [Burkholderiales bacterium]|nr:hypothetical protein [Burkholderiales bacterium]MBK9347523.1 hypothetical protein [Burkholderiales bacterium]